MGTSHKIISFTAVLANNLYVPFAEFHCELLL